MSCLAARSRWWRQQDATWRVDDVPAETLQLPEIGVARALADIYAGVLPGLNA